MEEWRGAAAPLSLTVWFKELLFASLPLCLSVALKGRELCLCSLAGICLKNKKKDKKSRKNNIACGLCGSFPHWTPWSATEEQDKRNISLGFTWFVYISLNGKEFFRPVLHLVADMVCSMTAVPAAFWIAEFPCKEICCYFPCFFDVQPKWSLWRSICLLLTAIIFI